LSQERDQPFQEELSCVGVEIELNPRTPWSRISRRASSTAFGLLGSTLANGMRTSAFAAATSAISSFHTAGRPVTVSASTVNTTAARLRSR
jgi:hypothetical protein